MKKSNLMSVAVLALTLVVSGFQPVEACPGKKCCGEKMFESMDKNNDGLVSKGEFRKSHNERMKEFFEKVDTDKNGKISKEEMEAKHEKKKECSSKSCPKKKS